MKKLLLLALIIPLIGCAARRNAEVQAFATSIRDLEHANKITYADGERQVYEKIKTAYNINNPFFDEYWAYRIMIAEKLDKGKISKAEANVLITQKATELATKEQELRNQGTQAMMPFWLRFMQSTPPPQQQYTLPPMPLPPNNTLHCRSYQIGGSINTDCQ